MLVSLRLDHRHNLSAFINSTAGTHQLFYSVHLCFVCFLDPQSLLEILDRWLYVSDLFMLTL